MVTFFCDRSSRDSKVYNYDFATHERGDQIIFMQSAGHRYDVIIQRLCEADSRYRFPYLLN